MRGQFRRQDQRAGQRQPGRDAELFRPQGRDVRKVADMRWQHIEHDGDMRRDHCRERCDLARMVRADLNHRGRRVLRQPRQCQRHPQMIVETAR